MGRKYEDENLHLNLLHYKSIDNESNLKLYTDETNS